MESLIIKYTGIWLVAVLCGCYYDVESVLYPEEQCNTANLTYATDIEPILQHNCYSCHRADVNNGNVTLEGYTELKKYVTNGKLLGAIRHDSGYQPMPKNAAKLGNCEIAKIEQWVNEGALNN